PAVLAVPIADTSLSIARRILRGRSIFSADREHIHHALLDAGVPHRRAVLILCGVSALFCAVALGAALVGGPFVAAFALVLCAGAALALRKLHFRGLAAGGRPSARGGGRPPPPPPGGGGRGPPARRRAPPRVG